MSKKLIALLVAVLLLGGIAFAATPGYRQDPGTGDILGQGKNQSDPHKIFRMVRTTSTSTLAADSIVRWDLTIDDGVTIATTIISGDSAVAGIIVKNCLGQETAGNTAVQDKGKRNWTWLQTYGKSQVNFATNTGTIAGAAMGCSTTAGEAAAYDNSVLTGNYGVDQQGNAGFFYDDTTSGEDDVECFLRVN